MSVRIIATAVGWLIILVSILYAAWSFYQIQHFGTWTQTALVSAATQGVPGSLLGVAVGFILLMLTSLDRRLQRIEGKH